jgi:thiamine pyrophosphokinase
MIEEINSDINFKKGVTLIGGGGFTSEQLRRSLKLAPELISADGGVNCFTQFEPLPKYIIGDLDSIKNVGKWKNLGTKILQISEQDSTDFEKCLRSIMAPKFICIGFTGKRLDHFLAVCNALVKFSHPTIVLGDKDLIFHLPKKFEIELPINSRFSLFPLKEIDTITSEGLKYPLDGILFSPTKRVGTSNSSVQKKIKISYEGEGMLAIVSSQYLKVVWDLF